MDMNVAVDVFVVAVVGFAAALALGMVVGRRRSQETRILILLVALLGVAGLVHVARVVAVRPVNSVIVAAPTTSSVPTTSSAPTTEQAQPRDRTAEFIALIGPGNYVPPDEMTAYGAPGANSVGTYPCRAETGRVVWTYPLSGAYKTFHAVVRPIGKPGRWPNMTFTVYTDDKQVFTAALDPVDGRDAPNTSRTVDVDLDGVQSLRLEVRVDDQEKCNTLVANWADIAVT
jgi:hypothetical protein